MKECRMLRLVVNKLGDVFPLALAIVIAPDAEDARRLGEKELEPYFPGYPYRLGSEDLGPILFPPSPTTVFLYTQQTGRIK